MEPAKSENEQTIARQADAKSLQEETLLAFTSVFAAHGPCNRKLALCVNAGQTGSAAALAVTALGGTCLMLDEDVVRLRTAGRLGATDFTVTDLSEALRILKNELRKGTPVGVGLSSDVQVAIDAMLQRGVQPDLVCGVAAEVAAVQPFLHLGAAYLSLPAERPPELQSARMISNAAENMIERRRLDQRLKDEMLASDALESKTLQAVQSRWLAVAPRLFPGDRSRTYWQMEMGK